MENKVFFIGAGPGSLDYLTLKGKRKLGECYLVFAPNIYTKTFKSVLKGKKVLEPFQYLFEEVVAIVNEEIKKAPVAFLLPGDETVFSPFQPFIDYYGERAEVIPGVGAVNGAAAVLKKTLDLPNVSNTIVLTSSRSLKSTFEEHDFLTFARKDATLVLYMNHIPLEILTEKLKPVMGEDCPIAIVYKVSLPEEEVVTGTLKNISKKVKRDYFENKKEPSMAIVIIGYVLKKIATKKSWDYRKRHIWDKRKR